MSARLCKSASRAPRDAQFPSRILKTDRSVVANP